MKTFAELNQNNLVINIIVADAEFVATQTNKTYVEYDETNPANIGDTYDPDADVFVAPQPYPSWTLDSNHDWQPPTPMPFTGGPYMWSEEELVWVAV